VSAVDVSHIWDEPSITKSIIALVPVRFQPLHNGHVEYILNLSRRFLKVIVLIEPDFGGDDDPFSLKEREEMVKVVSLKFGLDNVVWHPILGSEVGSIQERVDWYLKLVRDNRGDFENFVIVSGNPEVLNSYATRYKFNYIDYRKVKLDNLHLIEIDKTFFSNLHSNARKLRAMIQKGYLIPENLVLPEIVEIIKRRFVLQALAIL